MIDKPTTTNCLTCGEPIIQIAGRGHRQRLYCDNQGYCRQQAHRAKRKQETPEARIAALEKQVEQLQERLDIEKRFRMDTQVHDFRRWIRRHAQWRDIDFFKRFLDDTRLHVKPGTSRLMSEVPRSLYLARLRLYKYSEEDILLFEEAWKDMLFNQS